MKIKVILFFSIFSVAGISAERPFWITNPLENSLPNELCAVGEGAGMLLSETKARESLGKIFETKVVSSFKAQTNSQEVKKGDALKGKVTEETFHDLTESSDEVLKGAFIKDHFSDATTHYSLACFDKIKTGKIFEKEVLEMDELIKHLFKDGRRFSLYKILKLSQKRQALVNRYQILTGKNLEPVVLKENLYQKKRDKKALETTLLFNFDDEIKASTLKNYLVSFLTEMDYKIVREKDKKHDYLVEALLHYEKQHLNVVGFEKYLFSLTLVSKNKSGEEISRIKIEDSETGRNLRQAYDNALPYLIRLLDEQLENFNID